MMASVRTIPVLLASLVKPPVPEPPLGAAVGVAFIMGPLPPSPEPPIGAAVGVAFEPEPPIGAAVGGGRAQWPP